MRNLFKRTRVYFLRPLVNRDFLSRILFDIHLACSFLKRRNLVLLITTTKTGTHYLRFLLAYYVLLLEAEGNYNDVHVDHGLVDRFFPNSWHTSYTGVVPRINPDNRVAKWLKISDLPRSHMPLRVLPWRKTRIIHTYRNLDDQAVVSWFTKYACDKRLMSHYKSAQELRQATIEDNKAQYDSFRANDRNSINSLRVSFESLHREPANVLALVISWLGLEPNLQACRRAAFLTQQTSSVLVGGGEKWHRYPSEYIDQGILGEFIEKHKLDGAIGVAKKMGLDV
ncbi:sulfotransferase domain-containing protein [Luminiphilus sp.]|nr:sulfotransferase domain-containing protein [Luminiphilus sp.]